MLGYVGQLIGALIGGSLAERIGRRPVIVAAVLWFGLFSLVQRFRKTNHILTDFQLVIPGRRSEAEANPESSNH